MFLESLYLKNFRNLKESKIVFSPTVNLIEGDNAQGKTSLLEAIIFLSTGRSFRTRIMKELIAHGASFFYLEAHFIKEGISQTIKASYDGTFRKLQINQTAYQTFTPLLGLLPHVLYAPEDISLVTGTPQEKRRFLDLYLAQTDPLYLHHLTRYYHAMKQRNALLKLQTEETLQSWEEIMALASQYLIETRHRAIEALNLPLAVAMGSLSQDQDFLNLSYHPSLQPSSSYLSQFQTARVREKQVGYTLVGPHRDDLHLTLNDHSAKLFSSEVQKRCATVSLRFAEWHQKQLQIGYPPLLSIDDFGVHLDSKRHFLLQKQMEGKGQVFLTSPSFSDNTFLHTAYSKFTIKQGTLLNETTINPKID